MSSTATDSPMDRSAERRRLTRRSLTVAMLAGLAVVLVVLPLLVAWLALLVRLFAWIA